MNLATFVLIVVIVVIGVFATRHMLAAFKGDGACHGGGSEGKKVKRVEAADTDEANYPYAEDFKVGGMTCEHCVNAVETALNSLEGTWGRVDLEAGTAHVLSKTPIDRDQINAAVRDAGYYLSRGL